MRHHWWGTEALNELEQQYIYGEITLEQAIERLAGAKILLDQMYAYVMPDQEQMALVEQELCGIKFLSEMYAALRMAGTQL